MNSNIVATEAEKDELWSSAIDRVTEKYRQRASGAKVRFAVIYLRSAHGDSVANCAIKRIDRDRIYVLSTDSMDNPHHAIAMFLDLECAREFADCVPHSRLVVSEDSEIGLRD